MGERPTFTSEAVDWADIGYQLAHGIAKRVVESEPRKLIVGTLAEKEAVVAGMVFDALVELASTAGSMLHKLEGPFLPVIAAFVAPIIAGLFGAEVNDAAFAKRMAHGDGAAAGQAIVDGLFRAISGDAGGALEPSDAGARRIAGAAVAASLESTFNAMIPELISDLFPGDWLHFDVFTELPENIIRTLGVSRLVRRALSPLIDTTCATPMKWHIDKLHRPTLLSPASAARQIARGFGNADTWLEDMRRAGYSDERIAAIQNEQAHFFGAADVRTFVSRNWWANDRGLKHLRDQGYDEDAATDALRLEGLRRIDQLETQEANAIIAAYVAGDIDEGTFDAALGAAVTVASERALLTEVAHVRKAVNVKHLSLSQVEAMVKSKVLSVIDYRHAAEREGYDDDAVRALELQLRYELDRDKGVVAHRAELEAERAAEKKAKADAAAAKKAEIEAQRALDRRGKPADLERAAVRGLIPLARVEELYVGRYDPDTVAILMDALEADRQAYIAQQTARDEAAKRAGVRGIDVGQLEAATVQGVLTLDELATRLAQLRISQDDVRILVGTLAARMKDTADAKTQRDAAIAAAKVKHVSLATFETLVRRGHRTMREYDALLASLGFDDAARAGMTELLQLQIDDDAKARAAREAAATKRDAKGLTLDQVRRAVILGLATDADFSAYMVAQGFTTDAQRVLLEELRADVAAADAARQRRDEADAAKHTRDAPLSDVARAARLGLIPVATFEARLARAGYSADDAALEVDLLVHEMSDLADARQRRADAEAAAQDRGLSLEQTARAVRAGILPIAMYTATARSTGYDADAADTLTRLLQDEVDAAAAAAARRQAIGADGAARHVSLAQLEAAVKDGLATLDDYRATITSLGYGADDADLLVGLLARQLDAIDEARRRREAIAAAAPEREASLATLEQGVKDGVITMATFVDTLRARGYGDAPRLVIDDADRAVLDESSSGPYDDAELIALLLQVQRDAKAAKAGG